MKRFLFILILIIHYPFLSAQEYMAFGRFAMVIKADSNGYSFFGTLGDPFPGYGTQNGFMINPDPVIFSFAELETAIHDLLPIVGLKIHPNPAKFSTTLSREEVGEKLFIRLFDQVGNMLIASSWPSGENKFEIGLTNFPAGLYFIAIKNGEGNNGSLLKIVKQ